MDSFFRVNGHPASGATGFLKLLRRGIAKAQGGRETQNRGILLRHQFMTRITGECTLNTNPTFLQSKINDRPVH